MASINKLFVLAISLTASSHIHAHHSFSAEYDSDQWISVTGKVTEIRFRNPHTQFFIDVLVDGELERWVVGGQNVAIMKRSGISADTIGIGDDITVSGYAGRDGARKVYLDTMVTSTGISYSMYGNNPSRKAVAATEVASDSDSSLLEELDGDWAFDVNNELPGAPLHLRFEADRDGLRAILDNEVVDVVVGDEVFSIILDRENRAGFPARLQLTGAIVDGAIAGTVEMIAGYSNYAELDASSFTAVKTSAEHWQAKPFAPEAPVDLTGVWERSIALGPIGRTNAQLNDAGKARFEAFSQGAYDPLLRCVQVGPMRRQARRGNLEILASTNRLTFLYANDNGIRRIWLDREQHTAGRDPDVMGESIATWDGSTLVIDTRNLAESVLTHNSEPISSGARIVERLWLNEDGDMTMEATLFDPKYYERPVVKRLKWTRSEDTEMLYPPCDPDSFYRGLHFDGVLDSYYENQPGSNDN